MTEKEIYKAIKPFLEGYTEGLNWDFKKTVQETAGIIKDVLAFSNSSYTEDSYIIVGVSEPKTNNGNQMIPLSSEDRRRLNTDANYIYLPEKWDAHGLSADDIKKMKQFSATLSEKLSSAMLISHPICEFVPVSIGKSRWLYVIVVKHKEGVFISKKDLPNEYDPSKIEVKQGVVYVRLADTTIGAKSDVASATEHIRIWKKYVKWLEKAADGGEVGE